MQYFENYGFYGLRGPKTPLHAMFYDLKQNFICPGYDFTLYLIYFILFFFYSCKWRRCQCFQSFLLQRYGI